MSCYGKSLLEEEDLFHLAGKSNIAGLSETETNQGKEQPVHKVELVESCRAASSETNSFDKKRLRQFSE